MISFLGFIKEIFVAKYFGTSLSLDLYNLGLVLPMMCMGIVSSGIVATVTPNYTAFENKKAFFWHNCKDIFLLNSIIILSIAAITWLGYQVAFAQYEAQQQLILQKITVGFLPVVFLQGFSAYFDAILNCENKAVNNSIFGLLIPVGMLLSLIAFKDHGVISLVIGFYLGYLAKLVFQIIAYRSIYKNTKSLATIDDIGLSVRRDFIALSVSSIILAVMPVIINLYASKFSTGTVSSFNYAYRLIAIGFMLCSTVINSVYFPYISRKFVDNKKLAIMESVKITIGLMLIISICLVPIYFFSDQIVSLIFKRGEFNDTSVKHVTTILQSLIWHVPFYIGGLVLSRTILSLNKARIFVLGNLISIGLLVVSLYVLNMTHTFNVGLSFSLVYSISFCYLLYHCTRR